MSDSPSAPPPFPAPDDGPVPDRASEHTLAPERSEGPPKPSSVPLGGSAAVREATSVGENGFWLVPRTWALLVAALAAAGLLVSGLLWQKLGSIEEQLARRSLDSGAQAIEARTLARQAQEATRDLAARLALQESRVSEVSLQRSQLEELMQSLSRSRDENLVVDIDSALRLAQQQAQLTGSAQPLLAALNSADQRLARAAQPRLNPLQRAITRDTERIKAANLTDVPALLLKLDELVRLADDLPLANAMLPRTFPRAAPAPVSPVRKVPAARASASAAGRLWPWTFDGQALHVWSQRMLDSVWEEARKLLRVSRIDQPEADLLSPEQSVFLRENFKLRLLNVRLGLLSRQTETVRADLASVNVWLGKYFDASSRQTRAAAQLLAQVQSQLKTSELPRLDDTLSALATAAAGR